MYTYTTIPLQSDSLECDLCRICNHVFTRGFHLKLVIFFLNLGGLSYLNAHPLLQLLLTKHRKAD